MTVPALILAACLPATPSRVRSLPPGGGQAAVGSGEGPVRSLLALPPVPFEELPGRPGAYRARAGSLTAHYGPSGVGYAVVGYDPSETDVETVAACRPGLRTQPAACATPPLRLWRLSQELSGAQLAPPVALEPAGTVVSTFVGPASDWATGLPTFHRLAYQDAWPGIDVVYERAGPHGLKSTYYLAPGADPLAIRLLWRGADARIGEDGTLILGTPLGELRESPPVAWQELDSQRRPVEVRFALLSQLPGDAASAETEVGFALGAYDPSLPLTIDPTLLYASYLGGNAEDYGGKVAVDGSGAAYVSGVTVSTQTTFPNGSGLAGLGVPGFDQTRNVEQDMFVVKLNPAGTGLVYATYLGGDARDLVSGLAVDAQGAAYVTGATLSTEASFPNGSGLAGLGVPGFDQSFNGGQDDAFVVKLAPSGTAVVYATYLGGAQSDVGTDIAVDAAGAAYVTGTTDSTEATFPNGTGLAGLGVPGFDQTHNGGQTDVFVVKLAPDGRSLGYATYLGGSVQDTSNSIAVGPGGSAYVTGTTGSTHATFPNGTGLAGLGLPGLDQTFNGGQDDAYVVRLAPDGRSLLYATYLGGDSYEVANRIAVDGGGAAYVIGHTGSTEATFPDGDPNNNNRIDAPGFHQRLYAGTDAFVVKLTPDGSTLAYATYLSGSGEDGGLAIAVDGDGAAYAAGFTTSTQSTFPDGSGLAGLGIPGFDQTYNGGVSDAYVVKLAPDGRSLAYATFVGGDGADVVSAIAVDAIGRAYVSGSTQSFEASFPDGDPNNDDQINVPGFDRRFNGVADAYVVQIGPPPTSTPTPTATSTSPPTATPTSTPTPTPTTAVPGPGPGSVCAPRPKVQVATARTGDGRLVATLRAQTLPATPTNGLRSLRINGLANARVSVGGTALAQGQAIPLAAGTQEVVLLVERVTPGQAATVQLVVTDACGEWPTLVGGGPGAF